MYLLLFAFWVLLCGKLTVEIFLVGLVIVAVIGFAVAKWFGYRPATELLVLRKAPIFLAYLAVLLVEILKANLAVARCIVFRVTKVKPALITFRTDLKTDFGRYLLANSITLTPGTITIRVEGDRFTVHCLDGAMLDLSENGVFQRWIRRLEA